MICIFYKSVKENYGQYFVWRVSVSVLYDCTCLLLNMCVNGADPLLNVCVNGADPLLNMCVNGADPLLNMCVNGADPLLNVCVNGADPWSAHSL
uniref:Uncharacterized protein n=1 Tax=Anguilla anguilla TaxID=7936 RepID=A0A0E9W6W6_ANGAN